MHYFGSFSIGKDFESRLVSYIKGHLSNGESISNSRFLSTSNRLCVFDLFLPKGCVNLRIEKCSVVELKLKLQPDTLYYLYNQFLEIKKDGVVENCYVIYDDQSSFSSRLLNSYKKYSENHFYVYSSSEFTKGNRRVRQGDIRRPKTIDERELVNWKQKRTVLISEAKDAFSQGNNTFFLGAGLGASVNMPSWNSLLIDMIDKSKYAKKQKINAGDFNYIDNTCNHSPLILARYIESLYKDMDDFKNQMHSSLYKDNPKPTSDLFKAIVEAISTNKVEQAITFNYDDLLETALIDKNISVCSIFDKRHYSGIDFPVYHVHGMVPQYREIDSTPVLSEKEYHTLYKESFHWSNVVQLQALSRTTCFFIGLSMNDPNLRRLLDISRNGIESIDEGNNDRPYHYAILERKKTDSTVVETEKDNEFFAIQERVMRDLGINVLWYENGNYNEIPRIIRSLL